MYDLTEIDASGDDIFQLKLNMDKQVVYRIILKVHEAVLYGFSLYLSIVMIC